jgi:hypothetical protein
MRFLLAHKIKISDTILPMHDMTPGDRSIRNIPVSGGTHRRTAPPPQRTQDDIPLPKRRRRSRSFVWWALGFILVCVIAGLLLATLFEGATVTITPKKQQITPPSNITALPNATAGMLGYQTITVSQSATTSARTTGTQHVSRQASGVIIISNTYSTATQALVANTRFAAQDGKIYRIHSAIVVPGAKKNADNSLTAGTITATVYADAAGPEYNKTEPTTFTIPGFKGDPRYTKITARSSGPISGGFVGDQPAVSQADMKAAQDTLHSQIDSAIRERVASQIPPGFLPVQGSLQVTYGDVATAPAQGSEVSMSQTATASMAMINSSDLAAILAKLLVSGYAGEAVNFASPNPLVLQLASTSAAKTGPLTVLLQGTPTLVWQFDQGALKQQLLGKDKVIFQSTVESFGHAIEKAQASIRPFWKASFPTDPTRLEIVVN